MYFTWVVVSDDLGGQATFGEKGKQSKQVFAQYCRAVRATVGKGQVQSKAIACFAGTNKSKRWYGSKWKVKKRRVLC